MKLLCAALADFISRAEALRSFLGPDAVTILHYFGLFRPRRGYVRSGYRCGGIASVRFCATPKKFSSAGDTVARYIRTWRAFTQRSVNKKSPDWHAAGPGKFIVRGFCLVVIHDGDRFVHMMVGAIDMYDHAVTQSARFGIIFFFLDIVMSLVQKLAGLVQASNPRVVRVHGSVVRNVLAVVECGTFDFVDGVVDFFYGSALFSMQCASVRTFQVRPCIPQVGKGVQVGRMLTLRADVL